MNFSPQYSSVPTTTNSQQTEKIQWQARILPGPHWGTCLEACFCPCLVFGQNYKELKQTNENINVSTFVDHLCCCCKTSKCCNPEVQAATVYGIPFVIGFVGDALESYFSPLAFVSHGMSLISFFMQCKMRENIETYTNTESDRCFKNCIYSCFCYSCALAQENAHLKKWREHHPYNNNGGSLVNFMEAPASAQVPALPTAPKAASKHGLHHPHGSHHAGHGKNKQFLTSATQAPRGF